MREFTTAHKFRYSRNSLFENCIISAISAIKNPNIQALETDIQLTKDDIFVLDILREEMQYDDERIQRIVSK